MACAGVPALALQTLELRTFGHAGEAVEWTQPPRFSTMQEWAAANPATRGSLIAERVAARLTLGVVAKSLLVEGGSKGLRRLLSDAVLQVAENLARRHG